MYAASAGQPAIAIGVAGDQPSTVTRYASATLKASSRSFPAGQVALEPSEPCGAQLACVAAHRLGGSAVEQQPEQRLVQLRADEREPLLQSGAVERVVGREPERVDLEARPLSRGEFGTAVDAALRRLAVLGSATPRTRLPA